MTCKVSLWVCKVHLYWQKSKHKIKRHIVSFKYYNAKFMNHFKITKDILIHICRIFLQIVISIFQIQSNLIWFVHFFELQINMSNLLVSMVIVWEELQSIFKIIVPNAKVLKVIIEDTQHRCENIKMWWMQNWKNNIKSSNKNY